MKIKLALLSILLQQQLLPITFPALPIGCLYVLFAREPLDSRNPWLALFVLVHSIALAWGLGRSRSRSFAFVYTRGYSRDLLWSHKMLSTVLAVLCVWLPMALMVWTPVRSTVQDKMFLSPYFPLFAIKEASVPLAWLAFYAILLPMFHYVWIRRAQPTLGGDGAALLAIGLVIVAATLLSFRWHAHWFKGLMIVAATVISVTALVGGFLLHRQLEVQQ
jgi:hypothetical protein